MLPFSFIGTGTYTNAASALPTSVALSDKPDFFRVTDITNWGANSGGSFTSIPQLQSWWFSATMAAGSFRQLTQLAVTTTSASLQANFGTTNGFTFVDASNPPTFAALTATAINHTTFVVSMTNTGSIAVGDMVRITAPTGMLQAASITAQVTAVSVNTSITLGYIATAVTAGVSFTADATAAKITKYYPMSFYPAARQVMFIQQSTTPKVYFARPNNFTVGEAVDFNIPSTYGMTQLNFLTGVPGGAAIVTAVTNTTTESSITLNIDTSGFTAFSYPTSAASVGAASPPTCFPAGSSPVPGQSPPGTNLLDAFDNHNQFTMYIGSSVVGANSAVMQWEAWKADYGTLTNA